MSTSASLLVTADGTAVGFGKSLAVRDVAKDTAKDAIYRFNSTRLNNDGRAGGNVEIYPLKTAPSTEQYSSSQDTEETSSRPGIDRDQEPSDKSLPIHADLRVKDSVISHANHLG